MKASILIVDDEKDLCWALKEKLDGEGYSADYVLTGEDAIEKIAGANYDLVILDYKMPGMNGLETLARIKNIRPATMAIFITAHGDQDIALESLKQGAADYVHKPFNLENLVFRVYRVLRMRSLEDEVETLRPLSRKSTSEIVYQSSAMEKILNLVDRVAPQNTPILITGETGTGKDILASAVHHNTGNPRKNGPYISINCGAIPEPLIESELFGHEKGAFTGAAVTKKGLFEAATGGTFFLDEISNSSQGLQTRLLRVLDTGEFYRVGDTRVRNVNVRIIAASNRDLADEVKNGRFREDLYHRLKVVHIELPPLRDRRNDIRRLVEHFLGFFNRQMGRNTYMHPDVIPMMEQYDWPGNVRELKHCVENMILMSANNQIMPGDLPERITGTALSFKGKTYHELKSRVIEDFDRAFFTNLLKQCRGNVSETSRMANLARSYVIKKLAEYEINPKKYQ